MAGPGWKGPTPKGVDAVFHAETEFAYVLFRTQLFDAADLANVKSIQAGYRASSPSATTSGSRARGAAGGRMAEADRDHDHVRRRRFAI